MLSNLRDHNIAMPAKLWSQQQLVWYFRVSLHVSHLCLEHV